MSKKYSLYLFIFFLIFGAKSYSLEPACHPFAHKTSPKGPTRDGTIRSLTVGSAKELYCGPLSKDNSFSQISFSKEQCPQLFGKPYYQSFNRTPCQVNDCEIGLSFHLSQSR